MDTHSIKHFSVYDYLLKKKRHLTFDTHMTQHISYTRQTQSTSQINIVIQ